MKGEPLEIRFWRSVVKTSGCWVWTTKGSKEGSRGAIRYNGKIEKVHRISWFIHKGEMPPPQLEVCHTCDNTLCIRPDHLFLGTHLENMQDANNKGRLCGNKGKLFGEKHPMVKLDWDKVKQIRERRKDKQKLLAEEFGVSIGTIQDIIYNRKWIKQGEET